MSVDPLKIYVAGHAGMVGSSIIREFERRILNKAKLTLLTRTHRELDLTDQAQVKKFFRLNKPDIVVIAAARVGGINANNTYPAQFIYENLMMECNLINSRGDCLMRIKGAMTILKKRAEFYGMTTEQLIQWLDNRNDETIKVLQAYEVYKMHHGYQWSGENFETWVRK